MESKLTNLQSGRMLKEEVDAEDIAEIVSKWTHIPVTRLMEAEVQLLGRVTYEGFAAAWPSREGPFADKLNNDPKYVVSTTLKDPTWQNTTVISKNVPEEIAKLKAQTAGSILVAGSGTLVATLLEHDLVDELRLMVFPTILGRGRRLFPDGIDRLKLRLATTRTVGPDGVQVQTYERA